MYCKYKSFIFYIVVLWERVVVKYLSVEGLNFSKKLLSFWWAGQVTSPTKFKDNGSDTRTAPDVRL